MASRFLNPRTQEMDGNGDPYSGGLLYFYETGTSTPLDTYSDNGLTIANTNPVVADVNGRFGDIFLKDQDYKVVLKTSGGSTVWTTDPVRGSLFLSVSSFAETLLDDTNAETARTTLGLGDAATGTIGIDVLAPDGDGGSLTNLNASPPAWLVEQTVLNTIRLVLAGGWAPISDPSTYVDEFEDETGIDDTASLNETYEGTDDYYSNAVSESDIGDFTTRQSAAFDGTTTQVLASSATVNAASAYLGQSWSVAQTVSQVKVYSPSDSDYHRGNAGDITVTIYGKNGAPSNSTDGTVIKAATTLGTGSASVDTITGITATAYTHIWATFDVVSGAAEVGVAEIELTNSGAAPNLTLVTEAVTTDAAPDAARLMAIIEDVSDAITAWDDDCTISLTRDDGTTYTAATSLTNVGEVGWPDYTASGTVYLIDTGEIDISAQPSDTALCGKIVTANNRAVRIHAIWMQWE